MHRHRGQQPPVAVRLGLSLLVIGLTVVATEISAPILAIGIDSAKRGDGSLSVEQLRRHQHRQYSADPTPVMTAVALACIPVFLTGRVVTRTEGLLFVASYLSYLVYLIVDRT